MPINVPGTGKQVYTIEETKRLIGGGNQIASSLQSLITPVLVPSWTNGTFDGIATRYYYDLSHGNAVTIAPIIALYSVSQNQLIPYLAVVPDGTTPTTKHRIWLEIDPGSNDIYLRYC